MTISRREALGAISASTLMWHACKRSPVPGNQLNNIEAHDIHSFANPNKVRVRHLDLDLTASFAERTLAGTAALFVTRVAGDSTPLVLDTHDLTIHSVEAGGENGPLENAHWKLGKRDDLLGSPLQIDLPRGATKVLITYESAPTATGLQWLEAPQTAGKKHPFLFSQNESIFARTWIPLQDSPGVRITYTARIHAPENLLALMSANQKGKRDGAYEFTMELPVPSYLIALAIGDIGFWPTGPRTGVYAERPVLRRAAREFEDMERLVEAVEDLYGPYRWGRYDLLILPPGFPLGGMENPRLTFATPTVIAGDKSLVSLVSHELAHSWSGNLVTNATWSDFWLNEGLTTYIENRVQEAVYGREQALMEQVISRRELDHELETFDQRDQILHIDLNSRSPEDAMTEVPYIKGALFLRQMEETFGRQTFDDFLKKYFDHFSFQSITTATMVVYLLSELLNKHPDLAQKIPLQEWVYEPGLPASAPKAVSPILEKVGSEARAWHDGKLKLAVIDTKHWSTQQWLEFLQVLPSPLTTAQMSHLDHAFHFTKTGNDEILDQWLKMVVAADYGPAFPRLKQFLLEVGRMKMIRPLYKELMKTPAHRKFALDVYTQARPGYHPIAQAAIDKIIHPPSP
jgi:leukotriene-A4 hydrolase